MHNSEEKDIKKESEIGCIQRDFQHEKTNRFGRASLKYMDLVNSYIEIPEKFRKSLKIQSDLSSTHETAMNYHASEFRKRNDKMWELVKASCPSLDFERFEYSYNKKEQLLKIIGELTE